MPPAATIRLAVFNAARSPSVLPFGSEEPPFGTSSRPRAGFEREDLRSERIVFVPLAGLRPLMKKIASRMVPRAKPRGTGDF